MKKWLTLPILSIAFLFPSLSFAQSTAQLELARQVVTLQRGGEQKALWLEMSNGAAGVGLQKWEERASRIFDSAPKTKADAVSKQLDEELEKLRRGVYAALEKASPIVENEEIAQFYAQNFTEAELKALVAWFESPAFKKFGQLAPEIAELYMNTLMERTGAEVQDLLGQFDQKAADIINKAK